ncbi:MAG: hypothetical protein GWP10_15905 [Nitrospiraceae bacterium]|nr:hypothetical protein [Nitrospiraceae bacterium]
MKDAIMLLLDIHEIRMLIEALMLLRDAPQITWSEWEIDRMMGRMLLQIGLFDAERLFPEAYAICFPEGPPKIVGEYGKGKGEKK